MDLNLLLSLAIVLMLLLVAAPFLRKRRRTGHLAYRLGPEYEPGLARRGKRR